MLDAASGRPGPAGRIPALNWPSGLTHQGSVEAHLASYLDEFVFRFKRSRSRGMVFMFSAVRESGNKPIRVSLPFSRGPVYNHRSVYAPAL